MPLIAAGRNTEIFLPVDVTHTDALFWSLVFLDRKINISDLVGGDEAKQAQFLFLFPLKQVLLFSARICSVHMWLQ